MHSPPLQALLDLVFMQSPPPQALLKLVFMQSPPQTTEQEIQYSFATLLVCSLQC